MQIKKRRVEIADKKTDKKELRKYRSQKDTWRNLEASYNHLSRSLAGVRPKPDLHPTRSEEWRLLRSPSRLRLLPSSPKHHHTYLSHQPPALAEFPSVSPPSLSSASSPRYHYHFLPYSEFFLLRFYFPNQVCPLIVVVLIFLFVIDDTF